MVHGWNDCDLELSSISDFTVKHLSDVGTVFQFCRGCCCWSCFADTCKGWVGAEEEEVVEEEDEEDALEVPETKKSKKKKKDEAVRPRHFQDCYRFCLSFLTIER